MGRMSDLSAAIMWPKEQKNHNFIDKKILPWLDLHFPADSSFYGRIFLAYRRKNGKGIYDLTRRNIDELAPFVPTTATNFIPLRGLAKKFEDMSAYASLTSST